MLAGRIRSLDVLALAAGLWFLGKFLRYAFPPLFEPLQTGFGVDNATIGLAFTGFMLCYAAMQFPAGVFGDRLGPTRVVAAGGLIAGIASIGLIFEAGFGLLVLAMLVIGTGTGMHKTVSVTILVDHYHHRPGRALGIHDTIGAAGGIAAPIGAVLALEYVGWRPVFLVAGIAAVILASIFGLYLPRRLATRDRSAGESDDRPGIQRYLSLFRRPGFALFALVTVLFAFGYNGVVAFLPLYLTDVAGLSVGMAGLLYSLLFVVTVIQLLTGELSDRMGRLPVLLGCVALGMVGMAALVVSSTLWWLAGAVLVFGIGSHGYRPVRDAHLTTIVPDSVASGGLGIVRTLLMGSGAIAPAVVGVTADGFGFRVAFFGLGIVVAAALLGMLLITLREWSSARDSGNRVA